VPHGSAHFEGRISELKPPRSYPIPTTSNHLQTDSTRQVLYLCHNKTVLSSAFCRQSVRAQLRGGIVAFCHSEHSEESLPAFGREILHCARRLATFRMTDNAASSPHWGRGCPLPHSSSVPKSKPKFEIYTRYQTRLVVPSTEFTLQRVFLLRFWIAVASAARHRFVPAHTRREKKSAIVARGLALPAQSKFQNSPQIASLT